MITIVTMNSLAIRTTILWIHAIGGVAWIGASACFVIVASVTRTDEEEGRAMITRVASAIDRVGLAAFLFILLSGIVNLYIAGLMRNFSFSDSFLEVLAAKIGIYLAMFAILTASFRAEAMLSSSDAAASQSAISRLLLLNIAVMALGATALLLGLWLLGS
jgi:hypothetical protein